MTNYDHKISVNVELTVKVKFTNKIWEMTQTEGWEDTFYTFDSPYELAEMFAHNAVQNGVLDMTRLDGFHGRDKNDIFVEMTDVLYEED